MRDWTAAAVGPEGRGGEDGGVLADVGREGKGPEAGAPVFTRDCSPPPASPVPALLRPAASRLDTLGSAGGVRVLPSVSRGTRVFARREFCPPIFAQTFFPLCPRPARAPRAPPAHRNIRRWPARWALLSFRRAVARAWGWHRPRRRCTVPCGRSRARWTPQSPRASPSCGPCSPRPARPWTPSTATCAPSASRACRTSRARVGGTEKSDDDAINIPRRASANGAPGGPLSPSARLTLRPLPPHFPRPFFSIAVAPLQRRRCR